MDFTVWEQDDHQKSRNKEDNQLRRYKRPRILVNLLQTEYEVNRSKTKVVGSIQLKNQGLELLTSAALAPPTSVSLKVSQKG